MTVRMPVLAILAFVAVAVPQMAGAQDVNVTITADNAYGFGYGPGTHMTNYFGGVYNNSHSQIFSCTGGPETYLISGADVNDYLYIVAWSDNLTTQGVLGQFKSGGAIVYTGQGNWEVYATGQDFDGAVGPTLQEINFNIGAANGGSGPSGLTSIGWVGTSVQPNREGVLEFGEDNTTAAGVTCANPFPIACPASSGAPNAIDDNARWMWYRRPESTCAFRDGNHREFLIFRLPIAELLVTDLGIGTLCVTDSLKACTDTLFTEQPWHVLFKVINKGQKTAHDWSFDIDLVNLATGQSVPVKKQVPGSPIQAHGTVEINWPAPHEFDPIEKGAWRLEVSVAVKDTTNPDANPDNNARSVAFEVRNKPVPRRSDLGVAFLCVTDSLKGCVDSVFVQQPWHIMFKVVNKGEKPVTSWSYDVVLTSASGADTIPLKTQVPGTPLPVGASVLVNTPGPLFDSGDKGAWTASVVASVKDSANADSLLVNNERDVTFHVVNKQPGLVTDIGVDFLCVTDTLKNCVDAVFAEQPWHVFFVVVNKGQKTVDDWSFDIDLVSRDDPTTRIALKVQEPGPFPLFPGGGRPSPINWPVTRLFGREEKGRWQIDLVVTVKDPANPDTSTANNTASDTFTVVNKSEGRPQLTVEIWDWFNDTFPKNEDPGFPGVKALFDTAAAFIKTGRNIAQPTGDAGRFDVPGDTVVVRGSPTTARVDMVFRILPGPGNYEPVGRPDIGSIRRTPQSPAIVTKDDGSFWDVYRQNPGEFASPNAVSMHHNAKGGWDPNVWVSARCDTAEINLFALQGRDVLGGPPDPTAWMSTYHELDKRLALLGIERARCFFVDPLGPLDNTNIVCDGTVPAWVPPLHPDVAGTTTEYTKIIPDCLLTPGSHVQYFFRDQKDVKEPGPHTGLVPDTNVVSPQLGEGSTDGHRWQQFGVLPDRWKDPQYFHPVYQKFGRGPACLLVVDNADRRGNERVWVGVADTIGATSQQKWGAHNGWHARGDVSTIEEFNDPDNHLLSDKTPGFTVIHGGQPGTTWDLYQVKGSEAPTMNAGSLGSRLANRSKPILAAKSSRQGPTPAMLDTYYTLILWLTGDLNDRILGPFIDKSQDDCGILRNWLANGSTFTQNRGVWAIGDGFVESMVPGDTPCHDDLMANYFRVGLVHPSYRVLTGVVADVVDLNVFPEWQGKDPAELRTYGMRNVANDVLEPSTPLLTAPTSEYQEKGGPVGGPFYAGVFKYWDPASPWDALVDGWDIENLTSKNDVNTVGRSAYFYQIFNNVWAKIWSVTGTPIVPLDVPGLEEGSFINFVKLQNNPLASGDATIRFGLARSDRVRIRVYDVAGRLVRTLADREFPAGTHGIAWDGSDDIGRRAPRGVYLMQVSYRSQRFVAASRLIVLK